MTKKNSNTYYQLPILEGLELLNAKSCNVNFPFHTHNTFNITLVLENTFSTKLHNKNLNAPVGSICVTNANEVHATPCDIHLGNSFFTFYISPDIIKKLNYNQEAVFNERVIYDQEIFKELYFLSKNFDTTEISFEERLKTILCLLIRKYGSAKQINYKSSKLFQDYIIETTFNSFSLSKTAHQFGISKFKFLRLFKQETGLTPNNFILLKRIEKSKLLLKNRHSIFDVAIDCGFYDNSHYYKNFKRFTGVNPLDYQNAFLIRSCNNIQ